MFQKTFDKAKDFINTETGKMIKNTAEQQLGGKTSEEIEMEAVMNGDIYDDKYRETPIDSFNHLTLSEKFDYLRNNKEITKEMKNLRWKDVGALYSMKMDWRIKNENIKSEVIRKAHKAFIQGDKSMKTELSIYGINSIDDVRKRRNDIYETLVLSGNDASKIDEILDEQALQTPENYEKNVLRPLNELKTKHKLDKAESLTNKIFEIASAVKKNQDVKQQLLMYALNDMDSKEGTTAEANNNRVRDLVEKAIPYNNKLSADNRNPNKIKNILIVRLTSLLSQGGFLSADEERELMKDDNLGKPFFMHPEGGTIFDAKHLQTEADIKKAFNRIDNYIGWRDNYIKLTGKMRTQKTFDEVGTSNTGQNPLTKTPGQKYLDIDDIVKRSVFDDDDELDTVNLYEKNKRTSTIRSLLEENPTKLSMMFNEIEDPKYLSLSTIKEMSNKAKNTSNIQELLEYSRNINKKDLSGLHTQLERNLNYAFINDWDDIQKLKGKDDESKINKYSGNKAAEYKGLIKNTDNRKYIDTSRYPTNKIIKKDDKYYFKTNDVHGNEYFTLIDPNKKNQQLVSIKESNNPVTFNTNPTPENFKSYEEGRKVLTEYFNNPNSFRERRVSEISNDANRTSIYGDTSGGTTPKQDFTVLENNENNIKTISNDTPTA